MKVIFVNGSSHRDGTTMQLVKEMQDVFAAEHIDTEVIQLGNKAMEDCIQCGYCFKHNRCVFNDDEVNRFVEKAKDADGFVFATPVYYAHPSGRILSFLDRVFFSAPKGKNSPFAFKPGASIAVARRGGTTASFDVLNKYFGISQMPVAGSTYWNISHGYEASEAKEDEEGMQTMRNLDRNMIWMMRSFALAKEQGIPYPETEKKVMTNFIR